MLYLYPRPQVDSNWLHDDLLAITEQIVSAHASGRRQTPIARLIRSLGHMALTTRPALVTRLESLRKTVKSLSADEARSALASISAARHFDEILDGTLAYAPTPVPEKLSAELLSLFRYGFRILKELPSSNSALSIRDSLYASVYAIMPAGHFCPFCGMNRMPAPDPDLQRATLDHFLPISLYPLLGTALNNLVPMCDACNSRFKLSQDVLRHEDGSRRQVVSPHGGPIATVDLDSSIPFGGTDGIRPRWVVSFAPNVEAVETWVTVFRLRERFIQEFLDPEFENLLATFSDWTQEARPSLRSTGDVASALRHFARFQRSGADADFLSKALFEMLAKHVAREDKTGRRIARLLTLFRTDG